MGRSKGSKTRNLSPKIKTTPAKIRPGAIISFRIDANTAQILESLLKHTGETLTTVLKMAIANFQGNEGAAK